MIIPRSHATAFARLAYETAYLKAHHPAAFYCARLNAQPGGFYHPAVVVGDARRHGIAILGPDLGAERLRLHPRTASASGAAAVRLGLRYVRGLAEANGRALVAERERGGPFHDLADLCRRGRAGLTPDTVAALIAAGACDGWGRRPTPAPLGAPGHLARRHRAAAAGRPRCRSPPRRRSSGRPSEGWATGLPLTAHPLATQRAALTRAGILPIAALAEAREGATVAIAGLPVVAQQPPTATAWSSSPWRTRPASPTPSSPRRWHKRSAPPSTPPRSSSSPGPCSAAPRRSTCRCARSALGTRSGATRRSRTR